MNIRLLTNVLRVKENGQWVLTEEQIASKLNYFHLLELTRANPLRFDPSLKDRDHRTPLQEAQMQAYLRERMRHLWDTVPGLGPLPGMVERNPFDAPPDSNRRAEPPSPVPKRSPEAVAVRPPAGREGGPGEQQQVVTAAPDADLFVVAPPGTGKTHVLVDRIAHLVTKGLVQSPHEEILVLSYTRSAVAEVRRRLLVKIDGGAHPDVGYARVLTFDSLATRAIMLDRPPEYLQGREFTERIELFNEQVQQNLPTALEALRKIRFLFVDEVQDLSGHRALMVLCIASIVKQAGGTVCFLGDPAQAIYDFDDESSDVLQSTDFLEKLSAGAYGGNPPKRVPFEEYRRFETPQMLNFVVNARQAMGEDGLHPDGGQLSTLLSDLGERISLENLASWVQGSGSRAILTRTNLEAYQLWSYCDRNQISAELWRGASGNYWPGWIARLVLGFKQDSMPASVLEERWRQFVGPFVPLSFDEAMELLAREGVLSEGRLDLVQLNRLVGGGAPAATARAVAKVTISTIHRSKGLEFDEVLLYSPRQNFAGTEGEVRIVYVAATRAKRVFRILDKSEVVKRGYRNAKWMNLRTHHFHLHRYAQQYFGLLMDGVEEVDWNGNLDAEAPEELRGDAIYVWEQVGRGIAQNLEIASSTADAPPGVTLGGRRIATIAPKLHSDVNRLARWQARTFDRCTGLQLVGLAAHAYDTEDHRAREAFGVACLALSPVISGIATVYTR